MTDKEELKVGDMVRFKLGKLEGQITEINYRYKDNTRIWPENVGLAEVHGTIKDVVLNIRLLDGNLIRDLQIWEVEKE